MKSRIKATAPMKIIGYLIDLKNSELIQNIAFSFNAETFFINENSANETIGFLAGFKGFEKSDENCKTPPSDQCLIFSGFDSKNMDKLLSMLHKNNILIPLKCVVTQFNQNWKLSELIAELKKEHEQMNKNK